MKVFTTVKTAVSTIALSAALAGTSVAWADDHQEELLNMKSDSEVQNLSADKSAVLPNTREQSENNPQDMDDSRVEGDSRYNANRDTDYSTDQQQEYSSDLSQMDHTLHFQFDSTDLTAESQGKLKTIKDKLNQYKSGQAKIELVGFTDTSGPEVYNQYLSEKRAKAIKDELSESGIDVTNWEVEGKGEANPLADNDTREGRKENRRVEVNISVDSNESLSSNYEL